jgi:hypothetical protein
MKLSELGQYLESGEYARRESWMIGKYIRKLGITDNIEFIIVDWRGNVIVTRDSWSPRIDDLEAIDYSSMTNPLEKLLGNGP